MASGFHELWASISSWWQGLDVRGILLFLGEKLFEGLLQAVAVVVIGWLVVYRQWRQLTQGRSDQVVFSANLLTPIDGSPRGRGTAGTCSSSGRCCRRGRSTSSWTTSHCAG